MENEKIAHVHEFQVIAVLQTGNFAVCGCCVTKIIQSDYHD
jgi:hypothetical protein